jgi:tetratricopeptide (TPR) repeat protein
MGLNHILYSITPHDPRTLALTGALFVIIAVAAAFVPARRAAKADPMIALRVAIVFLLAGGTRVRAQSPLDLGRDAYRAHKSAEAIRWFEQAVASNKDALAPHLWLGRAYVQALPQASFIKQPLLARRARQEFDRALEIDPRNVDAREDRAIYYMYAPSIAGGGMDKARAEAEVVRGLSSYRGALLRAQIELHDKQNAVAEAEYLGLVGAYPDSAAPFTSLVGLYQSEKRYADAFAAVDRRLAAKPHDDWGTYSLGRTAALSGLRLDDGAAALRRYIAAGRFQPSASEAHAHYRLGMILELQHDAAGARAEYERAVQGDPNLADAKKALARLR